MDTSALLEKLSIGYLKAINGMCGLSLSVKKHSEYELDTFHSSMEMITILDFSGSILGFFAVSLEEQMAANILGLGNLWALDSMDQSKPLPESERDELRKKFEGFFKEVLNSVSGDCCAILEEEYPAATILAPKIIYGTVSYPKITCYFREVETEIGKFNFSLSLDSMKLEVNRLRDRLERMMAAEKELLEKTLKGSIKLLVDIVSIIGPDIFSRSNRVRGIANKIALGLHIKSSWESDVAALLSQVGCVTVPEEILIKKCQGQALTQKEYEIFWKHPQVGRDLLANIPRLEKIAEAILYQEKRFDGGGPPNDSKKGKEIPLIARILKACLDFDELVMAGKSHIQALEEMDSRGSWYDPDVFAALKAEILATKYQVRGIRANEIQTGMVLVDDLKTKSDLLLVPKRQEISEALRIRILNFAQNGNVTEPIKILELVRQKQ